ncbi:hypothetical protein G5B38_16135 [Pseudohalocynthiibacter aestuariivivens]|nr:hypothetical protein [Pseudohalocynthiibacter aestuariivivens]QIE46924.1 hypothetical protein G5B38_16135 [Pseudohalocynthiibacter aestuariivivens]
MPKTFMFLIIGLFFGAGFGFLLAATSGAELTGHAHGTDAAHDHNAHDHGDGTGDMDADHAMHGQLVEAEAPVPDLMLHVLPDGPQSRNLHIMVSNFVFAPQNVNGDHVPGQGHAHVYVDGVKQPRAYSPYVHLQALPKGTHEIRVTLNANNHGQLAVDGVALTAETTITIE